MSCPETQLLALIEGNLTPEEIEKVIRHLETCPACRERVKIMALLEQVCPVLSSRKRRLRLYLVAAGLLIFTFIPVVVNYSQEPRPKAGPEFAESRPYPHFFIEPRNEEHLSGERLKAFRSYAGGDYRLALSQLSHLNRDPEVIFYQGVCEYMLEMNAVALAHFSAAASLEERWKNPALWYQANIQLRLGKYNRAVELLKQLEETGGEYSSEAAQLLVQLQRDCAP